MAARKALGVLVFTSLSWGVAGLALGQGVVPPGVQPPVAPSGSTVEGQDAEGRIAAIDPAARTIRLDSGAEYMIPDAMGLDWRSVREGTIVKIRYSTNGGRNTITFLQILFR
jgi:hypothetical protein